MTQKEMQDFVEANVHSQGNEGAINISPLLLAMIDKLFADPGTGSTAMVLEIGQDGEQDGTRTRYELTTQQEVINGYIDEIAENIFQQFGFLDFVSLHDVPQHDGVFERGYVVPLHVFIRKVEQFGHAACMDIPQIGISVLRDIGYSAVFGKRIGQDFKLDIPAGKKGGKFSGEQFGVGTAEEYFALFGEILRMGIDKPFPLVYVLNFVDKKIDFALRIQSGLVFDKKLLQIIVALEKLVFYIFLVDIQYVVRGRALADQVPG